MKILTVDVGTGTQDIYLFDSQMEIENGYKLILPSPTLMVRRQLRKAAQKKQDVLLNGVIMGGGPCGWGVSDHIKSGLKVYATPEAALSFDDDLSVVVEKGVILVSPDEASLFPDVVQRIEMRDFDFSAIQKAFSLFGVTLDDLSAIAIAAFDHGNAPLDVSDRKFRFDYLDARLCAENRLSAFAYTSDRIPPIMTRLQAIAKCASESLTQVIVMDSAPAAVLGSTLDPNSIRHKSNLFVNIGNLHALGFRISPNGIEGVFEHHTHLLDASRLEELLMKFANGSLTNEEVFTHHGHGALIYNPSPLPMDFEDYNVVVTGPKRNLLANSPVKPYFAAPFGDMMAAGCFGLLRATADLLPELADPILSALSGKNAPKAPWEICE
ncbi:MAG: DUF1786 domain-containing protein [Anaerolineaceae bacterium]